MNLRPSAILFFFLFIIVAVPCSLFGQNTDAYVQVVAVMNVEGQELYGECESNEGGNTQDNYAGVEVVCSVYQGDAVQPGSCSASGSSPYCQTSTISIVTNQTYYASGLHSVVLNTDVGGTQCPGSPGFIDPLDYSISQVAACPAGVPLLFGTSYGQCIYPLFPDGDDSPPCPTSNPLLIATTTTPTFIPITIDPQGQVVSSKGTISFTSNDCPHVSWSATYGTFAASTGCPGNYTAPTISTGETDTITVKNTNYPFDSTYTQVDVQPVSVTIGPYISEMNQGQKQTFTATVPNCSSSCVTWTASSGSFDPNNLGVYTAPQVTSRQTVTITATSTSDTSQTDLVQVSLIPVTISFPASVLTFVSNQPQTITATVSGIVDPAATCAWSLNPPMNSGSLSNQVCSSSSSNASVTYIGPAVVVPTAVQLSLCVTTTPSTCATTALNLVPPVVISSISASWYAGQSNPITITGTGFGTNPAVTFSDPNISFVPASVSNTQITGTVVIPVQTTQETVTIRVSDQTAGIGVPPGAATANTVPVVLSISAVAPSTVSLDETQTQQFIGGAVVCKTVAGNICSGPPLVPTWSITSNSLSNPGTITQSGLYTAPSTGVTAATAVSGKACVIGTTTCSTFTINLQPINVTVNPSGVTLNSGAQQQFVASVQNAPNSNVNWPQPSQGTITSNGLFTAPSPISTTQSIPITACSAVDSTRCGSVTVKLQAPDFSIQASPGTQNITVGGSTTYTVTVSPQAGFTGAVNLSVTNLPPGATYNLSLNPIPNGGGSSTLTVFANSAKAGTYPLTITGTSGNLTHNVTVTLAITDFTLSSSPASQTVFASGGSTSYTVTVAPLNGFTGNIALSVTGLPKGATSGFSPSQITGGSGSSTLSVAIPANTTPNNYTLTITGTSGNLIHTATVTLIVPQPDFSIVSLPDSPSVGAGGGSTTSVTSISPLNGFTGTVVLSVSGLPSGTTGSFSPTSIANGSGSSTLTITTSASTPSGFSYPTITATSGSLSHTYTLVLTVFYASVGVDWLEPESVAGYGAPNTITVHGNADGGTGTVQLLWNDLTTASGWQTVPYQSTVNYYVGYGTWDNIIPSDHYCHTFQAQAKYAGLTSPVFTYTGRGSPYCPLKITSIEPQDKAGYGPPNSLIVLGSATGAPAGTPITTWWNDLNTTNGWVQGITFTPTLTTWGYAIPNVDYTHRYAVYVTYDGSYTNNCIYPGNDQIMSSCQ